MARMETIRKHSVIEGNLCKESCLDIMASPHTTATERGLAGEVVASFALTDVVADYLGLPRETSMLALAAAFKARLNRP